MLSTNGVTSGVSSNACAFCSQVPEIILKCGKCRKAIYCGKPCQKSHWPKHKKVCHLKEEKKTSATQQLESHLRRCAATWRSPQEYQSIMWPLYAKKHEKDKAGLEFPGLRPTDSVFDLGAGGGAYTRKLLETGCKVTSIDSFQGFTERMAKLQSKHPKNLTIVEGALSPELFPRDGSVTLILANDVLQYCAPESIVPLLQAVYASLKEGRQFVVTFPDLSRKDLEDCEGLKEGVWKIPNIQIMKGTLEEMGFRIDLVDKFPKDPRVLFCCTKR